MSSSYFSIFFPLQPAREISDHHQHLPGGSGGSSPTHPCAPMAAAHLRGHNGGGGSAHPHVWPWWRWLNSLVCVAAVAAARLRGIGVAAAQQEKTGRVGGWRLKEKLTCRAHKISEWRERSNRGILGRTRIHWPLVTCAQAQCYRIRRK